MAAVAVCTALMSLLDARARCTRLCHISLGHKCYWTILWSCPKLPTYRNKNILSFIYDYGIRLSKDCLLFCYEVMVRTLHLGLHNTLDTLIYHLHDLIIISLHSSTPIALGMGSALVNCPNPILLQIISSCH